MSCRYYIYVNPDFPRPLPGPLAIMPLFSTSVSPFLLFIKETIISPFCMLDTLTKDELTTDVWVYSGLCSLNVHVRFMPGPHCFGYCFVTYWDQGVLCLQVYSSVSRSLALLVLLQTFNVLPDTWVSQLWPQTCGTDKPPPFWSPVLVRHLPIHR